MTGALVVYAATFMRYSLAVTPKNYLLFACHVTNFAAQGTQAVRYLNYWKYASSPNTLFGFCHRPQASIIVITNLVLLCRFGGREKQLAEQAAKGSAAAEAGA